MPKQPPSPAAERLRDYQKKRRRGGTPEPFGDTSTARPGIFVVQCHDASALHYDLRLEFGGTLRSFAVPKGISADPAEKRLAIETEDHPIEYVDFEGIIPPGNYGAGAMIVWDRGRWVSHLDPEQSLADGKLLFDLYGYKLRGRWTLVRTSRKSGSSGKQREWLLIKKPDGWAREGEEDSYPEHSVLSGLTVDALAQAGEVRDRLHRKLKKMAAPQADVASVPLEPMLAQLTDEPFDRDGWLFELKYDGYRILAAKDQTDDTRPDPFGKRPAVRLSTRNGQRVESVFPEVTRTLAAIPFDRLILDGEVVVLDDAGRPSFSLLQQRAQTRNRFEIERATVANPVTYMAFDLLMLEGHDLRQLPLIERKKLLREVLPEQGAVRYVDDIEGRGVDFYRAAREMDLEGIVGKDATSVYRATRSDAWRKVRADKTEDFVVVGFTRPKNGTKNRNQAGFAALHLAIWDGDVLAYVGRVGTGFDQQLMHEIAADLAGTELKAPACEGELPKGKEHVWVEPRQVVEVRFTERTPAGNLRHPVFLRRRNDKPTGDCIWPGSRLADADSSPGSPDPAEVEVTRPQKVFWPQEEGTEAEITKGQLVDFYQTVAPRLLPWLEDRPLVLDRYPDGIHGKSFYQKNAPDFAPEWIRVETIGDDEDESGTDYFVCDDLASLKYIANLGAIPLHIWSSRVTSLANPDWCILDLDPKGAPFAHVVTIARTIHRLLKEIDLPSYPKTSGGSGLHVLIPLGRQLTHEQSRQLAGLLAQITVGELPDIATTARSLAKREDKVYVDFLQNGHGRLLVAPYSLRPFPGTAGLDSAALAGGQRLSRPGQVHPAHRATPDRAPEVGSARWIAREQAGPADGAGGAARARILTNTSARRLVY